MTKKNALKRTATSTSHSATLWKKRPLGHRLTLIVPCYKLLAYLYGASEEMHKQEIRGVLSQLRGIEMMQDGIFRMLPEVLRVTAPKLPHLRAAFYASAVGEFDGVIRDAVNELVALEKHPFREALIMLRARYAEGIFQPRQAPSSTEVVKEQQSSENK